MNTFRHEWRLHGRLLRGWLIAILLTLALFLSFYPAFQDGLDDMVAMMEGFPPEVLRGFGLDIDSFATYSGYLAYIYVFVQLLLGILSIMSGMILVGREKLNRSSDFLFSKPVSRRGLWLAKVAVGLLGLLIVNSLITAVVYGVSGVFSIPTDGAIGSILVSSLLVQLIFFFLGTLIAVLKRRLQTVTSSATAIGFGFYFLLIVARLLEDDQFLRLSLYGLFDTAQVQRQGVDPTNLTIGLGLIILLAGISYRRYVTQDLEV
ncbi:MAG TPA: ABC transporter permease subunit [Tissierellia bacterium]|nr:ABC transporter permease subunit [Tissierellia bacterium]